jgi:hypothetical protein
MVQGSQGLKIGIINSSPSSEDKIFKNFRSEIVKDQEELEDRSKERNIGDSRVERITRQRLAYEKAEREAQKLREIEEREKLRRADFLQSKERLMRKRKSSGKGVKLKGSLRFMKKAMKNRSLTTLKLDSESSAATESKFTSDGVGHLTEESNGGLKISTPQVKSRGNFHPSQNRRKFTQNPRQKKLFSDHKLRKTANLGQ